MSAGVITYEPYAKATHRMNCNHCGQDPRSPRGLSASAVYHRRHGMKGTNDYPADVGDFSRCVDYLGTDHPVWMRDVSPVWRLLVDHWGELLDLYEREKHQPRASLLYGRMLDLFDEARRDRSVLG